MDARHCHVRRIAGSGDVRLVVGEARRREAVVADPVVGVDDRARRAGVFHELGQRRLRHVRDAGIGFANSIPLHIGESEQVSELAKPYAFSFPVMDSGGLLESSGTFRVEMDVSVDAGRGFPS
jgi:hypothetical protein